MRSSSPSAVVRRTLAVATLAVALSAGVVAPAGARQVLGVGEQKTAMFSDPLWKGLHVPYVRYTVAWDVLAHPAALQTADDYMQAAAAAHAKVLLVVQRGVKDAPGKGRAPSVRAYTRKILPLVGRWGSTVDSFSVWNEANFPKQPTYRDPARVAGYYAALRGRLPSGVTLVTPSLLDMTNITGWTRRFEAAADRRGVPRRKTWALHNYFDVNRVESIRTRTFLRQVQGPVWLTETGGIVARPPTVGPSPYTPSVAHATRADRYLLTKVLPQNKRLTRTYLYHWNAAALNADGSSAWDSGLVDAKGRARPALRLVRTWLKRYRHAK